MTKILPYKLVTGEDSEILNTSCKDVTESTDNLREIIATMKHALLVDSENYDGVGTPVGLAAPQIGFPFRIIFINLEDWVNGKDDHFDEIWINPKVIWSSKRQDIEDELCLSLPNLTGPVKRPIEVKVEALDESFKKHVFRAKGFYARLLQHEIDHTNGILFTSLVKNKNLIRRVGE